MKREQREALCRDIAQTLSHHSELYLIVFWTNRLIFSKLEFAITKKVFEIAEVVLKLDRMFASQFQQLNLSLFGIVTVIFISNLSNET